MDGLGKRLRRLDDKVVGPPRAYEPLTPRETRLFRWMALSGVLLAGAALLLPDRGWVRSLLVVGGLIMAQPFVQDRVNRRIQRRG